MKSSLGGVLRILALLFLGAAMLGGCGLPPMPERSASRALDAAEAA